MTEFSDEYWMQLAYEQAELAAQQGEIPVGAIVVSQNRVIGSGYNAPISLLDPTAHAEIQAIRAACLSLNNYRLPDDATLYVTLEPCTMCVGALVHARIKHVVFGTTEPKAGSLVSARQLLQDGYYNHRFTFQQGCLQEKCAQQLSHFLNKDASKRNKKNNRKRP